MEPWVTVTLFGIAIFGFAWLTPARRQEERSSGGSDPAYDQLLEELETENRELLDAVTQFKQEQDETVKNLVKQIQSLERQVGEMSAEHQARTAAEAAAAAATDAAEPRPSPTASPAERSSEPPAAAAAPEPAPPQPSAAAPAAPLPIRERYAELLAQHRSGRSVEQIAKAAGMNKGEVQLILQLARREDEQLA